MESSAASPLPFTAASPAVRISSTVRTALQATLALPLSRRRERFNQRRRTLIVALIILGPLGFAIASLATILTDGWLGDWLWFWLFTGVALALSGVLVGTVLQALVRARRARPGIALPSPALSARALRDAVLAGDETLAPVLPLPAAESPARAVDAIEPPVLSVLRPKQESAAWQLVLVCFYFPVILTSAQNWVQEAWYIRVAYLALLLVLLWRVGTLVQDLLPRRVILTATGLMWRDWPWRTVHLPWREIRGWAVLFVPPTTPPRRRSAASSTPSSAQPPRVGAVYALVGERATLTWLFAVPDPAMLTFAGDAARRRTRARQEASQMLAALAHAQTALPLRDLTPAAGRLSAQVARSTGYASRVAVAEDRIAAGETPVTALSVALALLACGLLVAGIGFWIGVHGLAVINGWTL